MAEIERRRLALFMWPDSIKALREMALTQGYVITAGRGIGQGSVSLFLEALIKGKAQVPREQVVGRELAEIQSFLASIASASATLVDELVDRVRKGEIDDVVAEAELEPATVT